MYFPSLITEYNCAENDWLKQLYKSKEHWCPAFSNDYFSAGILSSQKVESANRSIS